MWVFHGSGTIWIGLSINLVFYLIVLAIVYRLFLSLTGSPAAAAIVSVLTGVVNRLMVEQATTLRMYMMLLLAMVLLLLAEFGLLRAYDEGRRPWKEAIFLFLVSTMGFLTHYDYWIFFAVTAALVCLWLLVGALRKNGRAFWRSKEFAFVLVSVCCFGLSLAVTIAVFPYCRWNLNTGKAEIALSSLFVISGEKAEHILWGYQRLSISMFGDSVPVWLGLLVIAACVLGGGILLYRKKEFGKLRNYALCVAALTVCVLLGELAVIDQGNTLSEDGLLYSEKYRYESMENITIDPDENAVYIVCGEDLQYFDTEIFTSEQYGSCYVVKKAIDNQG